MENKARHFYVICLTLLLSNLFFAVAFADDFGGTTSLTDPPTPPPACQNPPCNNPPCNASYCSENGGGPGGAGGPGSIGPGDFSKINCSSAGGQQVNFYSGEEYTNSVDVMIGSLYPIVLERSYSNNSTLDTALGYGWDHRYNQRLYIYSDGSVVIRTNSGTKTRFVYTGNEYVSEGNSGISLVQQGDGTFIFSPTPGWQHHFDRSGRLILLSDPNGNSLQLSWSEQRLPLKGRSPNGVNPHLDMIVAYSYQLLRIDELNSTGEATGTDITFSYDPNSGRMINVTDSAGRVLHYHHDEYGNLIRIDLPEGLFLEYQYTDPYDPNNLTGISRGYGSNSAVPIVDRSYDSYDRVVQENYAGGTLNITYNASLQNTTVTKITRNSVTGEELNTLNTVYEFYPEGYLHKITDDEKQVEYHRDDWNNVVEEILHTNQGTYNAPNLTHYKTVSYRYNDDNNLIQQRILIESGEVLTEEYTYDSNWLTSFQRTSTKHPGVVHRTNFELLYENNVPVNVGAVKILISKVGDVEEYNVITYEYDEHGQLAQIIFQNGDTSVQQNVNGLPTEVDGVQYEWDDRGNLVEARDANGNVMTIAYDLMDRIVMITDPLQGSTRYTYTGWNLTSVQSGVWEGSPGITDTLEYDSWGRVISSQRETENSPILVKNYIYDSNDNVLSITDQQGQTISSDYDNHNRVISKTDRLGRLRSYTYDIHGQIKTATDGENQTHRFFYDELGRLTKHSDPLETATLYDYGLSYVPTTVSQEGKVLYSFAYDLADREITQKTSAGGKKKTTLDTNNRIVEQLNADGKATAYAYDGEDRVRQITLDTDLGHVVTEEIGYDKSGNITWYTNSSISSNPLYNFSYDGLNRVVSKTLNPINKTVSYQYNSHGLIAQLRLMNGSDLLFSYDYSYDSAGRLSSITEQPGEKVTIFSYDSDLRSTQVTHSNGIIGSFVYDAEEDINEITLRKSDQTIISNQQYAYTQNAKINTITSIDGTTSFTYDELGRLVSADYPLSSELNDEQFSYDRLGNALDPSSPGNLEYDSLGRLIGHDTEQYTYDANGNVISESGGVEPVQYRYDSQNNIIQVEKPSLTTTYNYDLFGQRVMKANTGGTVWFMYEGENPLAEFDGQGRLIRNYSYVPETYILLSVTDNTGTNVVLSDHRNAPIAVMDENEATVWQANYLAYGAASILSDPDGDGTHFNMPVRLPGQLYDSETGMYYNQFRYYDPDTGRYITPDPLGMEGGLNLYLYGFADPVNNIDPSGLLCQTEKPDYKDLPTKILKQTEESTVYRTIYPDGSKSTILVENKNFVTEESAREWAQRQMAPYKGLPKKRRETFHSNLVLLFKATEKILAKLGNKYFLERNVVIINYKPKDKYGEQKYEDYIYYYYRCTTLDYKCRLMRKLKPNISSGVRG